MYNSGANAIVQMLLSCHPLFSDLYFLPNYVFMATFQYSSYDGLIYKEFRNASETLVKKIKFEMKFEGWQFQRIQIQMVEKDGKMVLGGQVSQVGEDWVNNCPVAGDMEELRFIGSEKHCVSQDCFYRLNDLIYKLNYVAGEACMIYDLNGDFVWNDILLGQPELNCSFPFGFNPKENLFAFRKDGECKEVDYSVINATWTPHPCSRREIDYVEPNKLSKYYHLRYLMAISGCEENLTESHEFDNTYVKFLYKNESLIPPTEPPSTTEVIVPEESNTKQYWIIGFVCVLGVALIIGLIVFVFWKKVKGGFVKCCPKLQKKEKAAPVVQQVIETKSQAEKKKEEKARQERLKEAMKREKEGLDSEGNVDDNLKSFNPMDALLEHELKKDETFVDAKSGLKMPTILHCVQPYRYVEFLGAGSFGRVYKYENMSTGTFVAVKFMDTAGKDEDNRMKARREFMLIRQIQQKVTHLKNFYILQVLDVGTFADYVFLVTPLYYRGMDFFMPGEIYEDDTEEEKKKKEKQHKTFMKSTMEQRLSVAWNYLKGIQQLHSVGYGHNDIKPENFMQKVSTEDRIILCDFGLVKRLGSQRLNLYGTLFYLPFTAHNNEDTSNVDDYQSWLFILTFMVLGKYLWEEKEGNDDVVLADLSKQKRAFYFGLHGGEKATMEEQLIFDLFNAIVKSHGPKNPVKPEKVIEILKKHGPKFNFKPDVSSWHNFD